MRYWVVYCFVPTQSLQIYRCTQIANVKAKDILKKINEVLEQTLQDEKGIIPLETRPKTIKSTLDHGEEMKIEVDHSPLRVEGNKKKTQPSVRELVSLHVHCLVLQVCFLHSEPSLSDTQWVSRNVGLGGCWITK